MENRAKGSVKAFLEAWKKGDHKAMLELCSQTYRVMHTFQNVRATLPDKLRSYEISGAEKVSDVMYDVQVKLTVVGGKRQAVSVRTICEAGPYQPSMEGDFGVNPLSIRHRLK